MNRDLRKTPRKVMFFDLFPFCERCCTSNFTILTQKGNLVFSEMLGAFLWVLYTMGGVKTGYPKSTGARIIHSSCKGLAVLIIVLATATITTVFTKSSSSTNIHGFADLGGHSVCTTPGTTSEDYLTKKNFGYTIVPKNSIDEMFAAFWNRKCDAVVYDQPALQNALVEHGGGAIIIGDFLTEDSYGIFMAPGNANQNVLTKAVVELNTDTEKYNALKSEWLADIKGKEGSTNVDLPLALFLVPPLIIVGVFVLAIIPLYKGYEERTEKYEEIIRAKHDTNYSDDYADLLKDEYDPHALWGNDWILSERVGPHVKRVLRVLYEMILKSEGKNIEYIGRESLPQRMSTFELEQPPVTEMEQPQIV
uniref:Solute-binding protein family 3/N-terminal domain-containing protein n=1 Tax=viral metagenome TaxID=1070528 RepID=A0A6C0ELI2_9ZZZZ